MEEAEEREHVTGWLVARLGEFGGVISWRRPGLELRVVEVAAWWAAVTPGMMESIPGSVAAEPHSKLVGVTL